MNVEIIDPTKYPDWDEMLLQTPGASFFQSSAWARVLSNSYGFSPLYFAAPENGRFKALVPIMEVNSVLTGKRGVSLPYTDYCDPILADGILFQDLFDFILQFGKKRGWNSLELRGGKTHLSGTPPSSIYLHHTLDLSGNKENVFASFRESTKRNIKKAIREGVEIELSKSLQSTEVFYRLNGMTRKEHGLPPQPYHFFKKVCDHILSKNLGFIVNAFIRKKPIASSVYFHFGDKVIYKYGASDKKYQYLRANNLVMWEAVKWCSENGYKSLCFGRTEPSNQGLDQFKAGWDTKKSAIKYFKYDLRKSVFITDYQEINSLYHTVFKKMPIPILNIIGSIFYRHMG